MNESAQTAHDTAAGTHRRHPTAPTPSHAEPNISHPPHFPPTPALQPSLPPLMPHSPKRAAIIGAGRVGSTLGARLLAAGWAVMYGSRHLGSSKKLQKALHAQPAAAGGGVAEAVEWAGGGPGRCAVLLTVPGSALASDSACAAFARSLGPFAAGQVVIDATNPLDSEGSELCWARGRSSAEVLAQCLPGEWTAKWLHGQLWCWDSGSTCCLTACPLP